MLLTDYFSKNGALQKAIPHYEIRDSQFQMAEAVMRSLQDESIAVIEAGTGVGKSLAYLLPAVLWAAENSKRVLVSTYSKALQEQLMRKELPFLKDELQLEFNFSMMMGSLNYICIRRLKRFEEYNRFSSKKEIAQFMKLTDWAFATETGLRSELDFDILPQLWDQVCRESDLCFKGRCPYLLDCPFMMERSKLNRANILVVNHHLFFANLAADGFILPKYDAVIFDEAHSVEEAALRHFTIEVTAGKVKYLSDNLTTHKGGFLSSISSVEKEKIDELKASIDSLRNKSELFFGRVEESFPSFPIRITESNWIVNTLSPEIKKVAKQLIAIKDQLEDPLQEEELSVYIKRAQELATNLDYLIQMKVEDSVYWAEQERKGRVSLKAASINIGDVLRKTLFSEPQPIVLTSATLSSCGNFDFLKSSLGIDESQDYIFPSPFDYRNNALIYLPQDLPEPSAQTEFFESCATERILEIVRESAGRALVLFTNYRHMKSAYDRLLDATDSGFTLLRQGELPNSMLVELFKSEPSAVLLATLSFWQGIDIPGEALSVVILVKLPFTPPDEPITEAKNEFCKNNGGNPFMDLMLPAAIVMLKQGFGRLIRSSHDRGVVAILDKRVRTKFYGKRFITSLPQTLYTSKLEDISLFLNGNMEN